VKRKRVAAVFGLMFILMGLTGVGGGGAMACPLLGPPGPEAETDLLEFLVSSYGDRPEIAGHETIEGLSLGGWHYYYHASEAFVTGSVTTSLSNELVLVDDRWVAPLRYESAVIGAIEAEDEVTVTGVFPEDVGDGLSDMESGDRLFEDPPSGMLFVVRGETATPLDELAIERAGGVLTLQELQQMLLAYYQPLWDAATEEGGLVLAAGAAGGDATAEPWGGTARALEGTDRRGGIADWQVATLALFGIAAAAGIGLAVRTRGR
jgi:hypothetical protein